MAPGEYLYGGRYKIFLKNGRFHCSLCSRTRETLHALYPHFRVVHPDGSGEAKEPSPNPRLSRRKKRYRAQKPIAPDAVQTVVPIADATVPVGCDEITELEYEGVPYKYDPIEHKYTCSLCDRCHAKGGDRRRLIQHIKDKHIGKSIIPLLTLPNIFNKQ